MRLDPVEFAGFDQGRDDGPVLCASVVPGEERVFAVRGREIEEMEKALEFDGGSWTVLGDASDVRRSEERGAILAVLSDASAPIGPKDIADALGKPENNVKQLLFKMLKDGEVKRLARGQYCIPKT